MIRAVLFDLDGVVRHFDPAGATAIEARHGLAPGALLEAVLAAPETLAATTGRITRSDWLRRVGTRLGRPEAVQEWGGQRATLDAEVVQLAAELGTLGLRTAILTNGTDTIPAEARDLGLGRWFEPIVSSAEIGYAKPDVRAFGHVLERLDLAPAQVLFTDDSPFKLSGATTLGMPVHHFTGAGPLREALRAAGVPLTD